MELELIGYDLCPYVHRARITVVHKNIPCKITQVAQGKLPDWLREISPSGRVPLLRVDGRAVIFESTVINEYLNDISGGELLPADPLQRALNRSWIEFGSAVLDDLYSLMRARTEMQFDAAIGGMRAKYSLLDQALQEQQGPFFNGLAVSLVDFDFAPIFVRSQHVGLDAMLYRNNAYPNVNRWGEAVCSIAAVQATLTDEFGEQLKALVRASGRYAAKRLEL
jgi:glutathione S-transferase